VWTSVATGKLPLSHGVRSAALYAIGSGGPTLDLLPDYCFAHALVYFGVLEEIPHSSLSVRVRTLWSVLGASGITSVVVRWPLTYPAQPTRGFIVSDRLHRPPDASLGLEDPAATYPSELLATIRSRPEPPDRAAAAVSLESTTGETYAGAGALALDRLYAGVFEGLRDSPDVRYMALRYQGLDTVAHFYLRQAMPRAFGDVSEVERRQYGRVLDQYYRYIDSEVGREIDRLQPNDLLVVASAFGMEPLSLPKRIIDRTLGSGLMSGTHERAPDGFLIAFGSMVRANHLARASVVDVTPTVLYYFGLPIGRDMDGFARTDIFTRAFTADRPVTYIPTYER
jgi:predicted AlkP superfamily phosphohydrolase/phosphomutase